MKIWWKVCAFQEETRKAVEATMNIAKELSDLIVYCVSSPVDIEKGQLICYLLLVVQFHVYEISYGSWKF